jgi:dihydrofolate reductase
MYILIAAMTRDRVIWKNNTLPWHYPADMKHFRETTKWCTVVMGRKTFESIGKPLPQRTNIVMSTKIIEQSWIICVGSIDEVHSLTKDDHQHDKPVYIIGGSQIYTLFLPYAKKILLTIVPDQIDGDTFFPSIDDQFDYVSSMMLDSDVTLVTYEKKMSWE